MRIQHTVVFMNHSGLIQCKTMRHITTAKMKETYTQFYKHNRYGDLVGKELAPQSESQRFES